jgi:tRNA threonylcarbamoyladenosine biosynthesis protein TsaE
VIERVVTTPQAMEALGEALAPVMPGGSVLLLHGNLGAGKTTFVRGLARGLGITSSVRSPTFAFIHHHTVPSGPVTELLHLDLYRVDDPREVDALCIDELIDDAVVAVVEWGELADGRLEGVVGSLTISAGDATTRTVTLEGPISDLVEQAGVWR